MADDEPRFCGGINWDDPRWSDPWRCGSYMNEYRDGGAVTHMCAASHDHEGDHCCALGHRWPQFKPRWRNRIRTRLAKHGGGHGGEQRTARTPPPVPVRIPF